MFLDLESVVKSPDQSWLVFCVTVATRSEGESTSSRR